MSHSSLSRCLALAAVLLGASACSTWEYQPLALPDDLRDVHTKTAENVTVSVAILSDEAALSDEDRTVALQRLRDESINLEFSPGEAGEDFVFTPHAIGGRYVDVRLVEDVFEAELKRQRVEAGGGTAPPVEDLEFRFGFALPLPDGIFHYERLDPDHTYPDQTLPDLSLAQLRERLEQLPCCSTDKDGDSNGDPLNITIIGNSSDVLNSLARAGWSFRTASRRAV